MPETESPLAVLRSVMDDMRLACHTLSYDQWLWLEHQRDAILELAITELMVTDRLIQGDVIIAMLYEVDNVNQFLALCQSRVQVDDILGATITGTTDDVDRIEALAAERQAAHQRRLAMQREAVE
jgi:hypothetical protein